MHARHYTVDIETDGSGDATVYVGPVNGLLHQLRIVDTDLDAGADFTVTLETSGHSVLTLTNAGATAEYAPRIPTHDPADGTELVHAVVGNGLGSDHDGARIAIAGERIKCVVAQGGASKSAVLHVWMLGH